MDNDRTKTNLFDPPIIAQYIRVVPVVCRKACTLRMELVGCELNGTLTLCPEREEHFLFPTQTQIHVLIKPTFHVLTHRRFRREFGPSVPPVHHAVSLCLSLFPPSPHPRTCQDVQNRWA